MKNHNLNHTVHFLLRAYPLPGIDRARYAIRSLGGLRYT